MGMLLSLQLQSEAAKKLANRWGTSLMRASVVASQI